MTTLQVGVQKSGNLWLWNLIEGLIALNGIEPRRFVKTQPVYALARTWESEFRGNHDVDFVYYRNGAWFYQVQPHFQARIEDPAAYVAATTHAWSHSFHGSGAREALARFGRVVYLVRDPRDSAVSLAHYHFTPFRRKHYPVAEASPSEYLHRNLSPLLRGWAAHAGEFLTHRGSFPLHFVFYERLVADFSGEAGRLAAFLGVNADAAALEKLRGDVSIDRVRAADPDHARRGGMGEWREALTARQKAEARSAAGAMMDVLGYGETGLPSLDGASDRGVRKALASAGRWTPPELLRQIRARYF